MVSENDFKQPCSSINDKETHINLEKTTEEKVKVKEQKEITLKE
jgi:hypothetical protein